MSTMSPMPEAPAPLPRPRPTRVLTAVAAILALLVPLLAPFASPPVRAQVMSRAEYEACQARDESGFRTAIEHITARLMRKGLAGLDYAAVMNEEWRKNGVDKVMDTRVDKAVDEIKAESSWTTLWKSLFSREGSKKLAEAAAERVYRSDDIKKAIESLAGGIGREVGTRLEIATGDVAEPAAQCVQAFLGPRYGAAVSRVVSGDTAKQFAIAPDKGAADVSTGDVLSKSGAGITGVVVLVVRRQLANMATRLGQRLVGAVLGRLVSVVAGGVGAVLIAKDVWDSRHGVLPIVADEMKSPVTKTKVRAELAVVVAEQINEHVGEIASKAAERVIEIWQDFRRAHAKVLELAERDEAFRRFLDTVKPERLARLDEAIALIMASEGESAILKRLADGTLSEVVNTFDEPAFAIARDLRALGPAFTWIALAGPLLPQVVEHELHRRAAAAEFSKPSLTRILGLADKVAIHRLASLKASVREPLLELDDGKLKSIARAFGESELESLSRYITGLSRPAVDRILNALALQPATFQHLGQPRVRDAILASRDQSAAVAMMLRSLPIFDFIAFREDLTLVQNGQVSPWLLWEMYPTAIAISSGAALLLLLVVLRLVIGRRPRIVVMAAPSPTPPATPPANAATKRPAV